MANIQKRDYQRDGIASVLRHLKRYDSTYVEWPTGSGKTLLFCLVAAEWLKKHGGRVLIVTPDRHITKQAVDGVHQYTPRLRCGVDMANLRSGRKDTVVCATIQSISRRLDSFKPNAFGLVIFDECDLARAPSWEKVRAHFPKAKLFGCTATPNRFDGKQISTLFESVAHKLTISELIKRKMLAPIQWTGITITEISRFRLRDGDFDPRQLDKIFTEEKDRHEIVKPLLEIVGSRPTLVFAVSVRHARQLAAIFNRYRKGSARAVSGRAGDGPENLAAFERGEFQFLCNCMLVHRGVNLPLVSCIAMARPTLSHTLYKQMLGRGTRTFEGKEDLLVVDFTPNSKVHNLEDEPPSKDGDEAKPREPSDEPKHRPLTAIDVLGANESPEVVVYAEELLKSNPGTGVLEAIEIAKRHLARDAKLRERVQAIVKYRREAVQGIDWGAITEDEWRTMSNTKLAKVYSVAPLTVQRHRPKHIRSPGLIDLSGVTDEMWRTMTNVQIASQRGCTPQSLRRHRPATMPSPYRNSGIDMSSITQEMWRTMSNRAIASQIGCSPALARRNRPKHIPSPYVVTRYHPKEASHVHNHRAKLGHDEQRANR